MAGFAIETARLRLRSWRDADKAPFAAICADPKVMTTLGPVMSRDESDALLGRVDAIETAHGHTFWALERKADAALIGWCGVVRGNAGPVDGKAEVGWRLAHEAWGHGYATEAARASLAWLFANLPDDTAWAITHTGNQRSREVMERLGMGYHPELDFDHPRIAEGAPLRRHVTYAISRGVWESAR